VNRARVLATTIISQLVLLLLASGGVAAAEEELWEAAGEPDRMVTAADTAVSPDDERQVESLEQKGGSLGYNFVVRDGFGGRALEYGFLHSSRSGGLFYRHLEKDTNLELEGFFLNEHDYHGDLLLDYRGDYRLHLRTESLFHNLDRELLFTDEFNVGTSLYTPRQLDSSADYGVSFVQESADFRYRLHNYPLHVNLGYWRHLKEGTIQQRFADTSFAGTPNTLYATARGVDRQTQEGRLGVDAHLGPLDVIYDFRVRTFKDSIPTPVANFVARPETAGGPQQHNEDPDSRFISHTVKLHSSLSGGLVGSGSYSIEERENLSRLSDTRGIRHATVHLQNAAGDLVYTPSKEYTAALKYRRQELDNGSRGPLTSLHFVNLEQPRPPVDSTKDLVSATFSYRPSGQLSLVGEYRAEFLKRDHVSEFPSQTSWLLPESSDTRMGSLALYYRPLKGLRMNANYSYTATDHPSYGSSFEKRHEGRFLTSYTLSNRWGATANVLVRRESNDEIQRFLVDFPPDPLDPLIHTAYPLISRDRRSENANLGAWFAPCARLTLGANYAYLQSRVDQPVLFTSFVPGSEAASQFFSRSHVYGMNASYALDEKLDLSLMLQQVRSSSAFAPQSTVFGVDGDTAGIRELSSQQSVISLLSARGEYRFTRVLSSSLEYSVRDYNEENAASSLYNGTVHMILAGVAASW